MWWNNIIRGQEGINYIIRREGNDLLYGGTDRDIYMYSPVDGNDVIEDSSGDDMIVFNGIDPIDVTFVCEGSDYIIYVPNGSIRIINQFSGSAIENVSYW